MHRRRALGLGAASLATALSPTLVRAESPGTTTTPEPYRPLGSIRVEGAREAVVSVDGETASLATMDGFAVVDVRDPASPRLRSERRDLLADREGGPLQGIQDVAVDGDRLLVVGPAHGGHDLQAALVYDVTDPATPERTAVYPTDYPIHNCYLAGQHAYLTANDGDANPLVIVDVTVPEVVSRWSILDRDERWRDVPSPLRVIHDAWVGDGVAVLSYWDAGTVLLDVSDPADPTFLGRVGDRGPGEIAEIEDATSELSALPGNHHYAELDPGGEVLAIGHEAWSDDPSKAPGGIVLWDVSTPDSPAHLARIPPPPTPDPSYGGTWTTAHNFDLTGGRLYSSWYQGGVKIHDVSDPAAPRELAWWRKPEEARFWTARHAGGFFVASSFAREGTRPALYTFPDRPGRQPDPPGVLPSPTATATPVKTAAATPTPTDTNTPTDTQTPTDARASTTSPPPTGRTASDASGSPTAHSSDARTTAETPDLTPTSASTTATDGQGGLGPLPAIVGLGTGVLVGYLRER